MTDTQILDIARQLLGKAAHELAPGEQNVLAHIESGQLTSRDAGSIVETQSTYGERLADRVAAVGGSWGFIIGFGVVLISWMLLNSEILSHWKMAFDPYPFIFLNLMLSMLAAIQAPIIMMSQNRQAAKDRMAASLDFEVNLRAELEILRLHEKIDMAVAQRLDGLSARQDQIIGMLQGR